MTYPPSLLCAWFDLSADGRDDWTDWHNAEHIPERLAIPGFLRARRSAAIQAGSTYFVMYEVRDIGVLRSPAYLARLNAPTDWTRRSLGKFRNNQRAAFRSHYRHGGEPGPALLAIRLASPLAAAQVTALERHLQTSVAGLPGIATLHFALGDEEASRPDSEEARARGDEHPGLSGLILVEGAATEPLLELASGALSASTLGRIGVSTADEGGLYQTEICWSAR
ncbi:DUF4286 family protein [Pigmentiphaga sp.]|uniref:DUF4286 family protein n=1 Tax=Pigmentiphaga sp. TaxID=1977564 RepID=UPI0025FEEA1F|nr:DUF4286 family protein [Pigmentiphaga sp.]